MKCGAHDDFGAGILECLRDIERDQRFVLNDKDRSPMKCGAFHSLTQALSAILLEAGRSRLRWTANVPSCRSILTPQQNEMIDLGGRAKRAGSVLRTFIP